MRSLATLLAAIALAGSATAQNTILFSFDEDELTLDNGNGLFEIGELHQDEIGVVTPGVGFYSAEPFLPLGAQWAYLGDADSDGRYADDSVDGPGDEVDALFVKANHVGPVTPRDVFMSRETEDGYGPGFLDSDVFRFAGPNGALEVFLTEAEIVNAIGQAPGSDVDLDAICQAADGALYLSFSLDESVGGVTAGDGALICIPAVAITYDAQGNVSSILTNTAAIVATESDMDALVINSGVVTSVGGSPSYSDLSALEIDPAGGTWAAPQFPGTDLQNMLFGWEGFSNDGAILSTAGGGTIATINGIPMGSTIATPGTHIGMLPDSTGLGGINGLALIPTQDAPFVVENYPRNLITSMPSWHQLQYSGATPNGTIAVTVNLGPTTTGGALPSQFIAPFGELFGNLITFQVLFNVPADSAGQASVSTVINIPGLVGQNLVFQGIDVTSARLSTPAALQFL
ncbi:MAG: hypothetical protein RL885_28040 [Planctomycetota bacterium]